MKKQKIIESTTLKEILEIKGAREILEKHNLPCLFCPMASFEMENLKIGDLCRVYGLNLKNLLADLNDLPSINREK